jgi:integrase
VRPTTEANYRVIVKAYIAPYVGTVKLSRLGPEHVQRMMRALEDKGRSPRTRALARTVLRRALGQAERWGRVPRNVVALTDPPRKGDARLDDALTAGDAARVLETVRGDRLEALAALVLAVGLRQGEALRLRWEDVDLDIGTVIVRVAKTDAGRRTVALPRMVSSSLQEHRRRQLEERVASLVWQEPELVFTTTIGTELDRRNVLRWWHDLTTQAGVGRRRFHASRHTAATLMLNNGVPLEVVSKTLGHAGLAITADVYAEVGAALQREAAEAMERVLGGSSDGRASSASV